MTLEILLPFQVFEERTDVARVIVETPGGLFGFWPNRLDCTAGLVPGILTYSCVNGKEVHTAIDEGILVKTGPKVSIAVRNAIRGENLEELRAAVESTIRNLDDREKTMRAALSKLETSFIRRLMELRHG